eukprot:Skav207988  [mRNA]  locus=scaffold1203:8497:9789:+ [translate_table: standard]
MWPTEGDGPLCPEGWTFLNWNCWKCLCKYYDWPSQCQAAGGTWCGITTSTTSSTTTTTLFSPVKGDGRLFHRLADGACRGSKPWDDDSKYFKVVQSESLEDCRGQCLQKLPRCNGIEYSPASGRCEIWWRYHGIFNTAPQEGSVCERFGWPVEHLEARFGVERECRGEHYEDFGSSDDWDEHRYTPGGLEDCKARCSTAPVCFGIEFKEATPHSFPRCKVWKKPVRYGDSMKKGSHCLTFPDPRGWEVVKSASGTNGPCRGLSPSDNNPNHYVARKPARWNTIEHCRSQCLRKNGLGGKCVGIEFSQGPDLGRCEVWTRPEGIYHAAENLTAFTCERWGWPVKQLQRIDPVGTWGACRGDTSNDNSHDYYEVHEATHGIDDCAARCAASRVCFGVEFAPQGGRCEVWTRPIRATQPVPGHECWAWVVQGF